MPDLPDIMSGNLKRMTVQDGRPDLSHAAALAPHGGHRPGGTPGKPATKGKAARRGVRLSMPPTGPASVPHDAP